MTGGFAPQLLDVAAPRGADLNREISMYPWMRAAAVRTLALTSLASVLLACGGAQVPPDARTTVVSMNRLDCAECGDRLAHDLGTRQGVYKASFDKRKAEVTVVAGPAVDVLGAARALSAKEEYELVPGAGKGSYIAWTPPPAGVDVQTVAKDGADVPDLAVVVVKGKVTVVDFSAIWCEPCRKLDEHMLGVLQKRPDVAYRKLDVGDWDSPLAQRYLKGIPSLPYVIVFDKQGQKVEAIAGLDLAKVDAAVERGAK